MTKTTQDVSTKTAAAAVNVLAESDAIIQAAVSENETLTQKVASFEEGESEFDTAIKQALDTLATRKVASTGDPVISEANRASWDQYITDPKSRKEAAAHLITQLIELSTKEASEGEGVEKSAMGDADEFPGRKAAADQDDDAVPTARY